MRMDEDTLPQLRDTATPAILTLGKVASPAVGRGFPTIVPVRPWTQSAELMPRSSNPLDTRNACCRSLCEKTHCHVRIWRDRPLEVGQTSKKVCSKPHRVV